MKLVRFTQAGKTRIGKFVQGQVIDLSAVTGDSDSMRAVLTQWSELRARLQAVTAPAFALEQVRLEAPIHDPQKYLAIGLNYKAHAEEARAAGVPIPTSQLWFNKQVSCISGPFDPIEFPPESKVLDYEIELGVVIGKRCRRVRAADARSVIAGYLVTNDVTARDWQTRSPTFTLGKSFDTHGPLGPWLTTAEEVADPMNLGMTLSVNGEVRQKMATADMIHDIWAQIEYLSSVMTLEPGDVIATGTPAGVGVAINRTLQVGDVVRAQIDQLGAIENRVIAG